MDEIKKRSLKRIAWMTAGVIFAGWLAGCAVIYAQMRKPPEEFGRFMMKIPAPVAFLAFPFESMWMKARRGTIEVGDAAPDFSLPKLDSTERLKLSELNRNQPVVLIFGSYT